VCGAIRDTGPRKEKFEKQKLGWNRSNWADKPACWESLGCHRGAATGSPVSASPEDGSRWAFGWGVAHDFNNILGIILGYSDISLGLVARDSAISRHLSEIKKATKRGAELTQQLLAFSRKQVVFPKILDLNDVVNKTTTMFLRLVGEDIEIEFRPTVPLGSVKADPGQIEQVLMNLVVNARDAMPPEAKSSSRPQRRNWTRNTFPGTPVAKPDSILSWW